MLVAAEGARVNVPDEAKDKREFLGEARLKESNVGELRVSLLYAPGEDINVWLEKAPAPAA